MSIWQSHAPLAMVEGCAGEVQGVGTVGWGSGSVSPFGRILWQLPLVRAGLGSALSAQGRTLPRAHYPRAQGQGSRSQPPHATIFRHWGEMIELRSQKSHFDVQGPRGL